MEIYKRLLTYLKPYKLRLFWSLVFMGITSGLIAIQAYLVQPVLDSVFLKKDIKLLLLLPPALMIVVILKVRSICARLPYGLYWPADRE